MDALSRILPADPRATYLAAQADIDAAIARVLQSGTYIMGPELAAFEREFATFLGARGAVGVANGTDALELALRACGVGPGDVVVTVANTVTATVSAIVATGAQPAYVDIEPDTMLLSVERLAEFMAGEAGRRVKAIVPVHLYGQACDMPALMALARQHGVRVVEDCAQAHGSTVAGQVAGTFGDLAAFSFYPTKNLGALGDAGAIVGMDVALLERCRSLRQYGWHTRYVADEHGRNSRLDEIQAAILRVRLGRLAPENDRRQQLADRYLRGLAGAGVAVPVTRIGRGHTWHQFVVRSSRRDEIKSGLERQGILSGILYPIPLHRQPAYVQSIRLPQTEQACGEVLSLPLHAGLTDADADRVIAAVVALALA